VSLGFSYDNIATTMAVTKYLREKFKGTKDLFWFVVSEMSA
jgi:hypothetical protein